MPATPLTCQTCSAPLAPGAGPVVKCGHCGMTSVFEDQILAANQQRDNAVSKPHLDILVLQKELERLDREWENASRKYADDDGRINYPTSEAIYSNAFMTFLLAFIIAIVGFNLQSFLTLLCLAGTAILCLAALGNITKGRQELAAFEHAKTAYERERAALTTKLDAAVDSITK